jgi:hypothetical protein
LNALTYGRFTDAKILSGSFKRTFLSHRKNGDLAIHRDSELTHNDSLVLVRAFPPSRTVFMNSPISPHAVFGRVLATDWTESGQSEINFVLPVGIPSTLMATDVASSL